MRDFTLSHTRPIQTNSLDLYSLGLSTIQVVKFDDKNMSNFF